MSTFKTLKIAILLTVLFLYSCSSVPDTYLNDLKGESEVNIFKVDMRNPKDTGYLFTKEICDGKGRVIEAKMFDPAGSNISKIFYTYNLDGKVTQEMTLNYYPDKEKFKVFKTITYTYENGKLVEKQMSEENGNYKHEFDYDAQGRITEKRFFTKSQLLYGLDMIERYTYDNKGLMTESSMNNPSGYSNSKNSLKYNEAGKCIEITTFDNTGKSGDKTSYKYDDKNNMTEDMTINSTGQILYKTNWVYDDKGRVKERIEFKEGSPEKFVYKY